MKYVVLLDDLGFRADKSFTSILEEAKLFSLDQASELVRSKYSKHKGVHIVELRPGKPTRLGFEVDPVLAL